MGFPSSKNRAAEPTLFIVARESFGSMPVVAAFADVVGFCTPTYPKDASFCISLEVNCVACPGGPLKCWSKEARWEAIVSNVAFEVEARLCTAAGSADKSYSSGLGARMYRNFPARHDSSRLKPYA